MPRNKQKAKLAVPAGSAEKIRSVNPSDKSARVVSALLRRTSVCKNSRNGEFIPLSKKWFGRQFGNNGIRDIKDALIQSGLVEENASFYAGNLGDGETFPMSYRFHEQYRSGEFEMYELNRRPCKSTSYIDEDSLGATGMQLVERLKLLQLPDDFRPKNRWDAYHSFCFQNNDIFAMRDQFAGRLHTTVTGMSGEARSQLRSTTGQSLGCIDIRACQPTILAGMVAWSPDWIRDMIGGQHPPVGGMSDYQNLCLTTDVYQWAADQFQAGRFAEPYVVYNPKTASAFTATPRNWDRDAVKGGFNIALFGTIEQMLNHPVYRLLDSDYPDVAAWLQLIKRKFGYKKVAQMCQTTEAATMIDCVCQSFMDQFPDEPIATIHDELVVPNERLKWVENEIIGSFCAPGVLVHCRAYPNFQVASDQLAV